MTTSNPDIHDATALNRFAAEQWERSLSFLQQRFGLPTYACKDIFQDAFLTLYENIRAGKLDRMTASLSTYFLAICRNKALQHLRGEARTVSVDSESTPALMDGEIQIEKVDALIALDNADEATAARKEALVREIVKDLPSPCRELLWGFYRDNLSMRVLAETLGYSSEGVAKVTKHRCCEKFRARYAELCHKIF